MMKLLATIAYAVVIVGYGCLLNCLESGEAELMANDWIVVKENIEVPANPAGVWTLALEWVEGPAVLRFQADEQEWFYAESDAGKCHADGHLTSLLATKSCILPSAPVGSLIAKIGGSSAGTADGNLHLIGKFCLIEISESGGPLYLTINDQLAGFGNNRGTIKVTISSRQASNAAASDQES